MELGWYKSEVDSKIHVVSPQATIKKITQNVVTNTITKGKCYTRRYSLNAKETNKGGLILTKKT